VNIIFDKNFFIEEPEENNLLNNIILDLVEPNVLVMIQNFYSIVQINNDIFEKNSIKFY
jgi:hypothetical protein